MQEKSEHSDSLLDDAKALRREADDPVGVGDLSEALAVRLRPE
ncbi:MULTISPECIES: hypothetical protein [Rhizobium]|uniref:Uncharacterized protein n=3 Tax=Rhizobium TaxID=379 RepID=A0ABY5XXC8_RHISU|nr:MULTISPECIES: hypothetical protein [Rhizobium]MBB3165837.1 hypothetical protein [Rhizobium laguerreae]MBB4342870.1 hypothetical protein [Rhizobium leguminosarum]MBB4441548.1 hypothetical protein [Rhizobium esperanzae]MBB5261119.1 hypothetical protein [Rhizobium leguminosarum]MBB6295947.1 hypothetical protein [Rhizobium leguminosarum]